MENSKSVTAVEWLEGKFLITNGKLTFAEFKQAKEMENDIEQKWLEYRDYTNNEDAWCFKEWLIEQFKKK